jgi:nickel superoxide dismutase
MSAFSSLLDRLFAALDVLHPPRVALAHCDIPCGIYDPHEAQLAALTVVRMDQLMGELKAPGDDAKPAELEAYHAQMARYSQVKEQHSDRCKNELRILWGDYFTADHVKQFPDLHETFWKALKAASKARQSTNLNDAQELVTQVQKIAEIFWKSKGSQVQKVPSMSKAGGDLVLPKAA